MRRRKKFGLLAMALACAGLMAPVAGADIVIDLFDVPNAPNPTQTVLDMDDTVGVFADPDGVFSHESAYTDLGGSILGGTRELFVDLGVDDTLDPNDPNDTLEPGQELRLRVYGGVAVETQDPQSAPTKFIESVAHITWDGTTTLGDLDVAGPNAFNLQANGENRFYVRTNDTVNASRFISIEVWDQDGDGHQAIELELLAGVRDHFLSFSSFDSSINFSNIGTIRMNFLTDDITIDSFSAVVPVPPAVGLGLLGMMVVGGLRRRKKASAA